MPTEKDKFWFPVKTYGWGWGLPNCWQGWLVMAVYVALICCAAFLLNPGRHPAFFIIAVLALSGALTWVCWLKGEKPGWHWGKE